MTHTEFLKFLKEGENVPVYVDGKEVEFGETIPAGKMFTIRLAEEKEDREIKEALKKARKSTEGLRDKEDAKPRRDSKKD